MNNVTLHEENVDTPHEALYESVSTFWSSKNIPYLVSQATKKHTKTILYDGPPFPTGAPHHGHMMTSAAKDTIIRYLNATGHSVPRIWGWDMHSRHVDKNYQSYIELWKKSMSILGRWIDNDDGYFTNDTRYTESVWYVFKTLYNKGYIKLASELSLACPQCLLCFSDFEKATLNSRYKGYAIYYKAALSGVPDTYLLIWEMRPWTVVGTTCYCINENERYIRCTSGASYYIISEAALNNLCISLHKVDDISTQTLMTYRAWDIYGEKFVPILHHNNIVAENGTGIMQCAPSHDEKSYDMWDAEYILGVTLTEAQILDRALHTYILERHEYMCPECQVPLRYSIANGCFLDITGNRRQVTRTLEEIYWEPREATDKILSYAEKARDWRLDRTNAVGTPIPLWICGDTYIVIGSYSELQGYGMCIDNLTDLMCCGKIYKWCGWTFDYWYDSACMPYGSVHYPFSLTKMEFHGSYYPATLVVEGSDQISGWFYTTNVISSLLFGCETDNRAFLSVISNGLILDSDGKKLSKHKSMGMDIETDPCTVMAKYGADNYRIYLLQNKLLCGVDFVFNAQNISRSPSNNLINCYIMVKSSIPKGCICTILRPSRVTDVTDNWILQALNDYLGKYHKYMKAYKIPKTISLFKEFINLIKKYIGFNGERLATDSTAVAVLCRVMYVYLLTVAPFMPHVGEHIYQDMLKFSMVCAGDMRASIHLCQIPVEVWHVNKEFLMSSDLMFNIIDTIKRSPREVNAEYTVHLCKSDIGRLRCIDPYIQKTIGRKITYMDDLHKYVGYHLVMKNGTVTEAEQHKISGLTVEEYRAIEIAGLYRTSARELGKDNYYIKVHHKIPGGQYHSGVYVTTNVVSSVHNALIIQKGQEIARELKDLTENRRCIIYVKHRNIGEIQNLDARNLLSDLNRYTLPILGQTIHKYIDQPHFASLCITIFDEMLN